MNVTRIVLALTVLAGIGYDVFAFVKFGQGGTISWNVYQISHDFPIVTLCTGIVLGHLFWRVRAPDEVSK